MLFRLKILVLQLMNYSTKSILSLLCWAGISVTSQPAEAADARPNIVLIMCDDMGFSDIGCYGGSVETPNIDRLAREGMRFTQFYNNAKCTTTRASILTGLYPRFGKPGHLRENMVTLGEALGSGGYQTSLSGKWHLLEPNWNDSDSNDDWLKTFTKVSHPFYRGFDRYYGVLDGACNFFDPSLPDPSYKGNRVRNFGQDDHAVTEFPKDYYLTDAITDHAIESAQKFSEKGEPFFIHITYTAPHYPLHAKPEDIQKYIGKFKMGWEQMRKDRWSRQQAMGLANDTWSLTETDSRAYDWENADQDFEDLRMAVYAAMIDNMDQNIGRLLSTLESSGELDNTLVCFLSDNGGCSEEPGGRDPAKRNPGPKEDYVAVGPSWGWAQNAPFKRYKSWLHEGGITTPMIARWPGKIAAGAIQREPAHIIDFMPTFLELAETDYPTEYKENKILPLEGLSMVPLLQGQCRDGHDQLAWFWSGNRAVRQGDWKLVWDKNIKEWELYNIAKDRCETRNLAPQNLDRVEKMAKDYHEWERLVELE